MFRFLCRPGVLLPAYQISSQLKHLMRALLVTSAHNGRCTLLALPAGPFKAKVQLFWDIPLLRLPASSCLGRNSKHQCVGYLALVQTVRISC